MPIHMVKFSLAFQNCSFFKIMFSDKRIHKACRIHKTLWTKPIREWFPPPPHYLPKLYIGFKGEVTVQNHHNFKRKHKNFPTDWCKNYENRIRNKEVVTFWNFKIFLENISWPVLMNIQMSELMMSSPHNFLHISCYKTDKNLIWTAMRM